MKKVEAIKRLNGKKKINPISSSLYLFLLVMIAFVFISCSSETREKIEIDVPNSVKEEIEGAAPVVEYSFFALKESFPKNIEEMKQTILFTYGEIDDHVDIRIIMASLHYDETLLFKAIKNYFINPNVFSGSLLRTLNHSLELDKGTTIEFLQEKFVYDKDRAKDEIISVCVEEMKKNQHSVLLIKRSIDSELLNQMVEIIFTNKE